LLKKKWRKKESKLIFRASRPGPIDTPFFHGQETKESVEFFTNATPLKRLGQVTDVVPVVEFLCLPESQWVTAQTILINGGLISR